MLKRILVITVMMFILFIGITIEKEPGTNKEKRQEKAYITYGTTENPDNLQLTESLEDESNELLSAFFSGLITEGSGGDIIPVLCDSYEVSEDGLQYTFHMKDNIYYSNGDKITASDYKMFLERFIADDNNKYRRDLFCIYGSEAFASGDIDFNGVAVNSDDDKTLVIRLNHIYPEFLSIMASPVMSLRDYGSLNNYKDIYETIRYTGPFIIENVDQGNLYISKNMKYEGSSMVTDEIIKIGFYDSGERALSFFENNDKDNGVMVDIIKNPPVNEIQELSSQGKIEYFDKDEKYYLVFNTINCPENFRRNVALNLEREEYGVRTEENIVSGLESYSFGFGTQAVFSRLEYGQVEDEVKTQWQGKSLSILYKRGTLNRYIAKAVGEDIKKAFDVEVNLIECTEDNISDMEGSKDCNMVIQNYSGKYGYEGEYLEAFVNGAEDNILGYNNGEYNQYMFNAARAGGEDRRLLLEKSEDILCHDMAAIPLCSVKTSVCISDRTQGVKCDSRGNMIFNSIKLK